MNSAAGKYSSLKCLSYVLMFSFVFLLFFF